MEGLGPADQHLGGSLRPRQHPQSVDQDYYVNWNNKQAKRFSAGWGNGSVHRGDLLDKRVSHSSSRAE